MNKISPERKTAYYFGAALMAIGFLMFASTFIIAISTFGNFNNFISNMKTSAFLAFGGMGFMIVGGLIKSVGARGLAGSGIKLDPEQAREDLKPYSKMVGGMVGDAIKEVQQEAAKQPTQVVKVRCTKCKSLNDESAKFCNQCGTTL